MGSWFYAVYVFFFVLELGFLGFSVLCRNFFVGALRLHGCPMLFFCVFLKNNAVNAKTLL